jgi:hypothetical protein
MWVVVSRHHCLNIYWHLKLLGSKIGYVSLSFLVACLNLIILEILKMLIQTFTLPISQHRSCYLRA